METKTIDNVNEWLEKRYVNFAEATCVDGLYSITSERHAIKYLTCHGQIDEVLDVRPIKGWGYDEYVRLSVGGRTFGVMANRRDNTDD